MTPEIQIIRQKDYNHTPDTTGEALLLEKAPSIKVWVPEKTVVVLGASQKPEEEINVAKVQSAGIPVFKRAGGGGAVVLSPRCICYGILLPREGIPPIQKSLEYFAGLFQSYLKEEHQISSNLRGNGDLCLGQKKILGSSLYLPRGVVLYLASVLVEDSLDLIRQYLSHPSREPEYRKGRDHSEFVTALQSESPNFLSPAKLSRAFSEWLSRQKLGLPG